MAQPGGFVQSSRAPTSVVDSPASLADSVAAAAADGRVMPTFPVSASVSDLVALLESVEVAAIDAALVVTVGYAVRRTQAHVVASFQAPGGVL